MQLQHVNVKLLVQNAPGANLEPLIPVFHSWIENQNGDELLIDVADYTHVPAGPGVVLIGHEETTAWTTPATAWAFVITGRQSRTVITRNA